jgi:putative ATP-binding cassette transporter
MVRRFLESEVGFRARLGLAGLIVLLLAINGLNVLNSYVGRDFMTAIEQRDWASFARQALLYVGVFALSTATAVFYRFTEERLGLLWRRWMTQRLMNAYLADHIYYHLAADGRLTNPDQRIADDVRSLVTSTLSFFLVFMNGTITVIAFSGVLWSISGPLFGVAVAYAAIGSSLAIAFGRPLVRLSYRLSDREANLRANLIEIRTHADSVALLDREPFFKERLNRDLDALVTHMQRIIAVNRNLGFFSTGYNYLSQIIPVLVVAPLFMRGEAEFGIIPQSTMAFSHVLGAFSLVVTQFPQLSTYAAVVARVGAFVEAAEGMAPRIAGAIHVEESGKDFSIRGLSLHSPQNGHMLVADLSLDVAPGQRVLVEAADVNAIPAMLRTIGGLLPNAGASVVRPPGAEIMLVPERPYLPPGTLRNLLGSECSEHRILVAVNAVGMSDVVERVGGLDIERVWRDALSLDDQRAFDLARVLLARPRFAVFERLASGVGAERARMTLETLTTYGTGCLVLGGGGLGEENFDTVIRIAADGSWTTTERADAA